MEEYLTEALVLDKEPIGEADNLIYLFTKDLGKITAKAISSRKIVSKLASHLEPLNFVTVRLVNKNRFHVVDALKTRSLGRESMPALHLIKDLSGEGQADDELWNLLNAGDLKQDQVLGALGFDNQFANCRLCGASQPAHFLIKELEYACQSCHGKTGRPASFVLE